MSRLIEESEKLREDLQSRNLYNPEDPYNVDPSKVVSTLNSIVKTLAPFKGIDLSNSAIVNLIDPSSKLAQYSTQFLGVQIANNITSNASREYLPSINFNNIIDNNPNTRLFAKKQDFEITQKSKIDASGFDKFRDVIGKIAGTNFETNPFPSSSILLKNTDGTYTSTQPYTNRQYILNTGKAQLNILLNNIRYNRFKNADRYNFYDAIKDSTGNEVGLNTTEENNIVEYGKGSESQDSQDFFIGALGQTRYRQDDYNSEQSDTNESYGLSNNVNNDLIWGRDGYTGQPDRWIEHDGGENNDPTVNPRFSTDSKEYFVDFNNENSLLKKTRDLLNSQTNPSFDQTRKRFIDSDGKASYRGSPVNTRPDGTYDTRRQHNVIDAYDRFAKAIRFDGNKIYGGHESSTIYEQVVPKFHPVRKGNEYDLNGMMFSIENLAIEVIKDVDNNIAYINEANQNTPTELPLCEAGPFGGRIMWFPPYDIKLREQVVSRHESTVFLGRSEPIYSYTHSERLATLQFKLIIDYPPQANGRTQKDTASFFAFGDTGSLTGDDFSIGDAEERINEINERLKEFDTTPPSSEPQITPPSAIDFYFPNDIPRTGTEDNAVDYILNTLGYEDGETTSGETGNDTSLNVSFTTDISILINEVLSDDFINFYTLDIVGYTTQLFTSDYNDALGTRRANSIKAYIQQEYKAQYNKDLPDNKFRISSVGESLATADTEPADSINTSSSKSWRKATTFVTRNSVAPTVTKPDLSPEQIKTRRDLLDEKAELTQKIKNAKQKLYAATSCNFNRYGVQDGIIKGWNAFETNKFQQVFHSQTPEDFHRRLTFLQQCARQGAPVRKYNSNENTYSSSNSVFGRQPVQVLRIGDFFHTKVIIENISFDYTEAPWDMNPEGMGMQFMIADIDIQLKIIGGQSLKTPIDMLQNAISFNYYANSTYYNDGVYKTATREESYQMDVNDSIEKVRKDRDKKFVDNLEKSKSS